MSPDEREQWIDRLIVPPTYEAVSAILDRVEQLERELAAARAAPPRPEPTQWAPYIPITKEETDTDG